MVNAIAYAPDDTPARQLAVAVSVGDYQKSLALTGERYWVREIAGWSLSEPDPILSLPIRYEFAFGGSAVEDDHEGHQQKSCRYWLLSQIPTQTKWIQTDIKGSPDL